MILIWLFFKIRKTLRENTFQSLELRGGQPLGEGFCHRLGNGVEDGLKFPAFFRKTDFDGAGVFVVRDLLKVTECRKPPHHDGNRRFATSAAAREFRESQGVFGKKDDEHVPVTWFDIGVAGVAQTAGKKIVNGCREAGVKRNDGTDDGHGDG